MYYQKAIFAIINVTPLQLNLKIFSNIFIYEDRILMNLHALFEYIFPWFEHL